MARTLDHRLTIRGTLRCCTPLHVGSGTSRGDVDLDLLLDGAGEPFVPGSSLAGALRAWATHALPSGSSELGHAFGSGAGVTRGLERAGRVTVADGRVTCSGPLELRDGVGIDRRRGAAAEGVKFIRRVVPAGSTISLEISYDAVGPSETDQGERLLRSAVVALRARQIRLGGATTRGLGAVVLEDVEERVEDHSSRAGFLSALATEARDEFVEPAEPFTVPSLDISIGWAPDGPLLVRAAGEGLVVDGWPLVSRSPMAADPAGEAAISLVLPGSSVKGVLRTHAERVVRTMVGIDAAGGDFLAQLGDDRLDIIHRLFGSASDRSTGRSGTARAGALSVEDAYSTWSKKDADWLALRDAAIGESPDRMASARPLMEGLTDESGELQVGHHVAIDRWTGGAADHLLFTTLEPHRVQWNPMRLRLDPVLLGSDGIGNAATYLLLLVLRDLCDGWLAFGHGTLRGHGAVTVDAGDVHFSPTSTGVAGLGQPTTLQELLGDATAVANQAAAWTSWITAAQKSGQAARSEDPADA